MSYDRRAGAVRTVTTRKSVEIEGQDILSALLMDRNAQSVLLPGNRPSPPTIEFLKPTRDGALAEFEAYPRFEGGAYIKGWVVPANVQAGSSSSSFGLEIKFTIVF